MSTKVVTEAGFYDGKFRKAGAHILDLDRMSKDELLAEAKRRGLSVTASNSKAEILAALRPPEDVAEETT